VEHWDGGSWHGVPPPAGLAGKTEGISVSPLSADDAWMVADGRQGAGQAAPSVPYVLQWKDRRWTAYRFAAGVWLNQVLAFSDSDVWAFGARYATRTAVRPVSVNYHFDGRTWQRFSLPIVADDAAAAGPHDIWSAGQAVAGTSASRDTSALAVHWDGSSWQTSRLPAVGPLDGGRTVVGSVVVAGHGDVWTSYASMSGGGCCHLDGLLHLTAGKWQHVGLPDFGTVDTPTAWLAQDGDGGIWLERPGQPAGPGWLAHYSHGRWTRTRVGTDGGAPVTLNGALTHLPATRQVWVMGRLTAPHAPGGASQVALLELR